MNNFHVMNDISEVTIKAVQKEWNATNTIHKNETLIVYVRKGYAFVAKI